MANRFVFWEPESLGSSFAIALLPAYINADSGLASMFFNDCFDLSRFALSDSPNISKFELSISFHTLFTARSTLLK